MSAWLDVLKFAPGYLSFAWVVGTEVRKSRARRHQIAIGPAKELRDALELAQRLFADIQDQRRRPDWFADDERRSVSRTLINLAARIADPKLRDHIVAASDAWDAACASAPELRPMITFAGHQPSEQERRRSAEEEERFAEQAKAAAFGYLFANRGLFRLNDLERKTIGR